MVQTVNNTGRDTLVGTLTRQWDVRSSVRFWQEQKIFLESKTSRTTLLLLTSVFYSMIFGVLSSRVQRTGYEGDHSPPWSAACKREGNCTSTRLHTFMRCTWTTVTLPTWYIIKYNENISAERYVLLWLLPVALYIFQGTFSITWISCAVCARSHCFYFHTYNSWNATANTEQLICKINRYI